MYTPNGIQKKISFYRIFRNYYNVMFLHFYTDLYIVSPLKEDFPAYPKQVQQEENVILGRTSRYRCWNCIELQIEWKCPIYKTLRDANRA